MKVLTAAQMHEVDRRTIESGIPGLILMENAAHGVVRVLRETHSPLPGQRIAVFCGKGNNGGDGLAIARLLETQHRPAALHVILAGHPGEYQGDAAANLRMLEASGVRFYLDIPAEVHRATLVVDALLGTGLEGPARGRALELIRSINSLGAPVVAVDVPSGLDSDRAALPADFVRAQHTVTFTAPKVCHALAPSCDHVGALHVVPIGSRRSLFEDDPSVWLSLTTTDSFRHLLAARPKDSNKGAYGHALILAGSRSKPGAAALAGLSALRAGAGLVTVASAASAVSSIAGHAAELMTEPLAETGGGTLAASALDSFDVLAARKNVLALGPGLGTAPDVARLVRGVIERAQMPVVLDADALNVLGVGDIPCPAPRILTPHPGEMARLTGLDVARIQAGRVNVARTFATKHGVWLVLKGHRTLIASPEGEVAINPTGSPAMATGGTGDVLTGLITGLLAQHPHEIGAVLRAAVWLHGRAGELAAQALGELCVIAGDLLRFLPEAIRESAPV
jgi:hydroxyethylthiazole kinase-like uncharacterized protein yjeF